MKQRSDNADFEIQRLHEKLKILNNNVSDMSERNVLLQGERDYYKQLWASACPEGAAELSEYSNGTIENSDSKGEQINVIATYIREIESLKALLLAATQKLEQQSSQFSSDFNIHPFESIDSNCYDGGSLSTSALEGELTANVAKVISETQKELLKEQRRLKERRISNGSDDMCLSDDVDVDEKQKQNPNNAEEEDKSYQRRQKIMTAELHDITESIQVKEQLVLQLQKSQKQYEIMKRFYEEKLVALCREMDIKESEKLKITEELQEILKRNESATKRKQEDELTERLREKDKELQLLKQKQEELSGLSQVHSRSAQHMQKLEAEIVAMKRQRVELQISLQSEKKSHYVALNQKVKEIDKLKRELAKTNAKMQQLGQDKEQAEQKVRNIIRENTLKRRFVNEQNRSPVSAIPDSAAIALTSERTARRAMRNVNVSGERRMILTENQEKIKKWLDKQVREIASREEAVGKLKRQCEMQLSLLQKKKMLEDSKASIRDVIVSAKTENDEKNGQILSAEEEDALAEIEDRISTLDGQLIFRNQQISDMESTLDDPNVKNGRLSSTVEKLKTAAANSLPAAHELIQLIFDMLVSSKKIAWNRKLQILQFEEREKKLSIELEEARHRLNVMARQHSKDLDRLDREYEEKIAGLVEYSSIGHILNNGSSNGESTTRHSITESRENLFSLNENGTSLTPRLRHRKSISSENIVDENNSAEMIDALRTMLMVANDKNTSYKERIARDESRIQLLNIQLDELIGSNNEMKNNLMSKGRDAQFLEDECRMLREIVADLKSKSRENPSLSKQVEVNKLGENKLNVQSPLLLATDVSSDDDLSNVEDDENLEALFSTLGKEISQHGELKYNHDNKSGRKNNATSDKNIFDRLTNPSNFTGTQKNIFDKDVEINRAKVAHIKAKESEQFQMSQKKNSAIYKSESEEEQSVSEAVSMSTTLNSTGEKPNVDNIAENVPNVEIIRVSSPIRPPPDVGTPNQINSNQMSLNSRKSQVPSNDTSSQASASNVFSRLLNPSKFTGIHKYRQSANVAGDSLDDSSRGMSGSSSHGFSGGSSHGISTSHSNLLAGLDDSKFSTSTRSLGTSSSKSDRVRSPTHIAVKKTSNGGMDESVGKSSNTIGSLLSAAIDSQNDNSSGNSNMFTQLKQRITSVSSTDKKGSSTRVNINTSSNNNGKKLEK
jgi:hypothetical protein